ncbi:hypothetical protein SAMD00019534_067810 [Acytostelium subglobosum LB1]|uniref:hypothetical protein n=1 Tax=Acytostelium subglobosum LB1 TaxID=1410327 RepID=UPI0006448373|nr:hypothetical protein SAMD00019534_067810 [Acytostelium subglobosum LB1]GAM23606.1 hypothetical protein SAMD00019534_067810 [Acytostelium subglobosum LB1]|eukprot:XP_012753347.1 hypothetical protein SAMD00019534_067810 [Acytostelium subglobosum LB1]
MTDRITAGNTIHSNHPVNYITNGGFYLVLQQDGNLVVYRGNNFASCNAIWSTQTHGKGHAPYRLTMQHDGNLVIYDASNAPTWATATHGKGHGPHTCYLSPQGGVHVVDSHSGCLYSSNGSHATQMILPSHHHTPSHPQPGRTFHHGDNLRSEETLHSNTNNAIAHGNYFLVMQDDGNLVLYTSSTWTSNNAIWSTQTFGKGHGPFRFVMQHDGNAVVYDSHNQPTWSTCTHGQGHGPYKFHLHGNADLTLNDSHHHKLWSSHTGR